MNRWCEMAMKLGGVLLVALFLPGGIALLAWGLYRRRLELLRQLRGYFHLGDAREAKPGGQELRPAVGNL